MVKATTWTHERQDERDWHYTMAKEEKNIVACIKKNRMAIEGLYEYQTNILLRGYQKAVYLKYLKYLTKVSRNALVKGNWIRFY